MSSPFVGASVMAAALRRFRYAGEIAMAGVTLTRPDRLGWQWMT